jgi:branched-chain amino acid aminotransferase
MISRRKRRKSWVMYCSNCSENNVVNAVGYVDGVVEALENTKIPVADRGFLYGDSVYEVFRTYSGIPFLFDEHYDRLLNSAELIGMSISQSKQEILEAIRKSVKESNPEAREDVYVRYQITRGEGPIDLNPDLSDKTRLVIIVKGVPQWNQALYDTGVTLAIPSLRRNSVVSLDPNIKSGNYLNNIIALAEAKKQGADDCLMLDAREQVTECSNSNVWFVLGGKLVTPKGGNLNGLTRASLITLLEESGVEPALRPVHHDELGAAKECFITSATREVMPVKSLRLLNGEVLEFAQGGGDFTRRAMKLYSAMIKVYIERNRSNAWY